MRASGQQQVNGCITSGELCMTSSQRFGAQHESPFQFLIRSTGQLYRVYKKSLPLEKFC